MKLPIFNSNLCENAFISKEILKVRMVRSVGMCKQSSSFYSICYGSNRFLEIAHTIAITLKVLVIYPPINVFLTLYVFFSVIKPTTLLHDPKTAKVLLHIYF